MKGTLEYDYDSGAWFLRISLYDPQRGPIDHYIGISTDTMPKWCETHKGEIECDIAISTEKMEKGMSIVSFKITNIRRIDATIRN